MSTSSIRTTAIPLGLPGPRQPRLYMTRVCLSVGQRLHKQIPTRQRGFRHIYNCSLGCYGVALRLDDDDVRRLVVRPFVPIDQTANDRYCIRVQLASVAENKKKLIDLEHITTECSCHLAPVELQN
uniref:Interleukin-17F n=1 Tax=Steinernema glaseri TaxID=37863 RepID=A0A1I7Z2E3_9BILA